MNLLWWIKGCFYITPFITFWCRFGQVWCGSLSKSDTGLTHTGGFSNASWGSDCRAQGTEVCSQNQINFEMLCKVLLGKQDRRAVQGYLQMSRGREAGWMSWLEQWAKIQCSRSNALEVLPVTTLSALHIPGIDMCHQSTNNKSCEVLQWQLV